MTRSPLVLAALAALMGAAGVALAAAAVHMSGGELAERGSLFLILHAVAALGDRGACAGFGVARACRRRLRDGGRRVAVRRRSRLSRLRRRAPLSLRRPDRRLDDDSELDRAGGGVRGGGAETRGPRAERSAAGGGACRPRCGRSRVRRRAEAETMVDSALSRSLKNSRLSITLGTRKKGSGKPEPSSFSPLPAAFRRFEPELARDQAIESAFFLLRKPA